jgi:hypothetical protein
METRKNVARVVVWGMDNHRAPLWIKDFADFEEAGEYMERYNEEGYDCELGCLI